MSFSSAQNDRPWNINAYSAFVAHFLFWIFKWTLLQFYLKLNLFGNNSYEHTSGHDIAWYLDWNVPQHCESFAFENAMIVCEFTLFFCLRQQSGQNRFRSAAPHLFRLVQITQFDYTGMFFLTHNFIQWVNVSLYFKSLFEIFYSVVGIQIQSFLFCAIEIDWSEHTN